MHRQIESDISLRDVYRVLFRHKKKAVLFFAAAVFASLVLTALADRVYRSEAMLFVRLGRENVGIDATATLGQGSVVAIPQSRENELNSVVEVLRSRHLIERLVDQIGPETLLADGAPQPIEAQPIEAQPRDSHTGGPSPSAAATSVAAPGRSMFKQLLQQLNLSDPLPIREQAILHVGRRLKAEAGRKSNVLRVTYDSLSPEFSQQVAGALVESYLDEHVRLNRAPGAFEFLVEQTARAEQQLTEAENELQQLQDSTGLAAPEQQRQLLVARISRLEDELLTAEAALASTSAEVDQLRTALEGLDETKVIGEVSGVASASADGMRQQLYALELQEKELEAKYTAAHPELQKVRKQIAAAQVILDAQEPMRIQSTRGISRAHEETELSLLSRHPVLAANQAKTAALRSQLATAQQELQQLSANEYRLAVLQRRRDLLDADYRRYANHLEQARIDQSLQDQRISNISLAQPPSFNPRPVSPRKMVHLALGLLVGAAGAFSLAWLCERLDHSFQTPEDIERRLQLPTLGTIPRLRRGEMVLSGRN